MLPEETTFSLASKVEEHISFEQAEHCFGNPNGQVPAEASQQMYPLHKPTLHEEVIPDGSNMPEPEPPALDETAVIVSCSAWL